MDSKLLLPPAGIVVPAPVRRFLRALRSALARGGLAIWRALEEQGRLRALRELELRYDGWQVQRSGARRVVGEARAFLLSQNASDR